MFLVATVSLVSSIGIFTGVVIYVGQLVGPDYRTMANIETGFMDVSTASGRPSVVRGLYRSSGIGYCGERCGDGRDRSRTVALWIRS